MKKYNFKTFQVYSSLRECTIPQTLQKNFKTFQVYSSLEIFGKQGSEAFNFKTFQVYSSLRKKFLSKLCKK